jgi:phosphoribosylanthranilate isomerase
VRVEVKVCGLMRADDARVAAELGARYLGVIFAGGPRNIDPHRARKVLDGGGPGVDRVGVFGVVDAKTLAGVVETARLDIVQLHADPRANDLRAIREATGARIWAVVRVAAPLDEQALVAVWESADALVLDSKVANVLGGSGTAFEWSAAEEATQKRRGKLVVAGGLTPGNVGEAIETLTPDIVDVSSGVESSPGIKDHVRIADFIDAVRRAGVLR